MLGLMRGRESLSAPSADGDAGRPRRRRPCPLSWRA